MKPAMKLFAVLLLTAVLILANTSKAYQQTPNNNYLQITTPGRADQTTDKKAPFFVTFCRTPFAIITAVFTLFFVILILFFEFMANVFTGFSYKYPVTNEIKSIGWDGITADWWWNPAQTWHLWVCIFLWIIISGAMKRRQ